jgi:hypothetical protein
VATQEPVGQCWAAVPPARWPGTGTPERAALEQTWKQPFGDRINEVVFIGQNLTKP